MNKQDKLIINRLIDKSQKAFLFAIEIMNKPTLNYRSENFTFNICNAWELLLKALIVKLYGEETIYYKDNKARTITFTRCMEMIFTDYKNPIKENLEIINKLRNKSTHFIIPEYDDIYVSVFQANVLYYTSFLKEKFDIDLNEQLPSNFLIIASNIKSLDDIRALNKLDSNTFSQFIKEKKALKNVIYNSESVAVSFEVNMKSVRKGEDIKFKIDSKSNNTINIIREFSDPNNTHPFKQKSIVDYVNKHYGSKILNQYSFRAIKYYEKFENSKDMFYHHKQSNTKCYSQKAVNLIIKNIDEHPNYLEIVINEFKKSK